MRRCLVRVSSPHGNKRDETKQAIRIVPPKEIGDYSVAINAFRSGGGEHSKQAHLVGGVVERVSHCTDSKSCKR